MLRLLSVTSVLLASSTVFSSVIEIPAMQPSIQAGIDAAGIGDTILVSEGVYTGEGNQDIDFARKAVLLVSESGPESTIIDCQGTDTSMHRGIVFRSLDDSCTIVDGFSIINGYAPNDGYQGRRVGGAIYCDSGSSPVIRNCIMHSNSAWDGGSINCFKSSPRIENCRIADNLGYTSVGGAIYGQDASPVVKDCEFNSNQAACGGAVCLRYGSIGTLAGCTFEGDSANLGAGVYLDDAIVTISGCQFRENQARHGAAIYGGFVMIESTVMHDNEAFESGACLRSCNGELVNCTMFRNSAPEGMIYLGSVSLDNCVMAFNVDGPAIYGEAHNISCSDIFGNKSGDWTANIEDQFGINGNLSVNPMFCDTANAELSLWYTSPCLPESTMCGLIGALDRGCSGHTLPVAGTITYGSGTPDYAVRTLIPRINWVYTDTLSTTQQAYELEVGTDDDWTLAEMWSTGAVLTSDTSVVYSGVQLLDKSTYYVRIRLQSEHGWGSWEESRFHVRLLPDIAGPSDWVTYQYNMQRTAYNDRDLITVPLQTRWQRHCQEKSIEQLTVVDDYLVWSSRKISSTEVYDNWVMCLNSSTGDSNWAYTWRGFYDVGDLSQATYAYGSVYFQVENGPGSYLQNCDLVSGQTLWYGPFRSQTDQYLAPAVDGGWVVMSGGMYGGLYGFEASEGLQWWFTRDGVAWYSEWAPSMYRDTVYLAFPFFVSVRDKFTGAELYRVLFPDGVQPGIDNILATTPIIDTVQRVLYCAFPYQIYAFDLDEREFLWHDSGKYRYILPNYEGARGLNPALFEGNLYAVKDDRLVVYDGRSGDILWERTDVVLTYPPVIANGLLFVGSDDSTMAVDIVSHEIVWACKPGGYASIANNSLYIATHGGEVYCYGPMPTDVEEETPESLPTGYVLYQNYPNPFNPSTEIHFILPKASTVRLDVYNILGQRVTTLIDDQLPPGEHSVTWNASNRASGVYLFRLQADDFAETKKMVLVK